MAGRPANLCGRRKLTLCPLLWLLLESAPLLEFSRIYRFRYGQQIGQPVSLQSVLDILAPDDRSSFTLLGFDFTMIPTEQTPTGQRNNTLYVVAANGDQSWAFTA